MKRHCPHCGAILRKDSTFVDKPRRGEFTLQEYATTHGLALSSARLELERGIQTALYAKRRFGKRGWVYRKTTLNVQKTT